jgi:hypothetical protein
MHHGVCSDPDISKLNCAKIINYAEINEYMSDIAHEN